MPQNKDKENLKRLRVQEKKTKRAHNKKLAKSKYREGVNGARPPNNRGDSKKGLDDTPPLRRAGKRLPPARVAKRK